MLLRTVTAILLALGSATFSAAEWTPQVALRGVAPGQQSLYVTSDDTRPFTCLDNSKSIPFSAVNDDYCDCADGSDEPGTSACSNGTFYCANEGHIGADIRSSRVNDGVCDPECCDGSDEYLGLVKCPNKCKEVGAAHRKRVEEERRKRAEGGRLAREYIEFGAKRSADRVTQISELERTLEKLEKQIKKLEGIKTAAEAATEHNKSSEDEPETADQSATKPLGKCCPTRAKCREMLDEQLGLTMMLEERIEYLEEGVFHLDNVESSSAERDIAVKDTLDRWEDYKLMYHFEEDEGEGTPPENSHVTSVTNDESTGSNCCSKLKNCKKQLDQEQEKFLHLQDKLEALAKVFAFTSNVKSKTKKEDEWVARVCEKYEDYRLMYQGERIPVIPDLEELDVSKEEAQNAAAQSEKCVNATTACRHQKVSTAESVLEKAKTYLRPIWRRILSLFRPMSEAEETRFLRSDPTKAAAKLLAAEASRIEFQNKLSELKKLNEINFGPVGIWEKLYKQCFDADAGEYKYQICLLDQARQNPKSGAAGTNLGTFSRWGLRDDKLTTDTNRYKYMMYENGDRCWNGPARSVEVALECGAETKLLSVVEMNKCEYMARMHSPAACELDKENSEESPDETIHSKDEL